MFVGKIAERPIVSVEGTEAGCCYILFWNERFDRDFHRRASLTVAGIPTNVRRLRESNRKRSIGRLRRTVVKAEPTSRFKLLQRPRSVGMHDAAACLRKRDLWVVAEEVVDRLLIGLGHRYRIERDVFGPLVV